MSEPMNGVLKKSNLWKKCKTSKLHFTNERTPRQQGGYWRKKVTHDADDVKNEQLVALKLIFFAISPLLLKLCEIISDFEKHSDEEHKEDDRKMNAELVAVSHEVDDVTKSTTRCSQINFSYNQFVIA